MMRRIAMTAALALLGANFGANAAAAITIDEAHYEAGVLVVRGKTAPGAEVTVDGNYRKKAGDDGVFIFRLNYKPENCRVKISAGVNDETRDVTNCATPADKKVDTKVPTGTTLAPSTKP